MSATSPIPCIQTPNRTSTTPATTSSHSFSTFRLPAASKTSLPTIRSSQTEGPIRRPAPPSLRQPSLVPPLKPTPPSSPVSPPPRLQEDGGVVTMEFQRQKAKELQDYFRQKKLEDADRGPFFGFVGKNEISNGRWAMFGFAVGLLTEYATGSDFVDQVKILFSNFGILDLD